MKHREEGKFKSTSDQLANSLIRELRLSLTFIAKQAEYEESRTFEPASEALRIIDNYLMCASSEYGQRMLPLEPVGPGSILYELSVEMGKNRDQNIREIVVEPLNKGPLMCHKKALIATLNNLACVVVASSACNTPKKSKILLSSHRSKKGDHLLGVFSSESDVMPSDIKMADRLSGQASMALPDQTSSSAASLSIAKNLASAMGGELVATRFKNCRGLAVRLLESRQLSLVGDR